MKITDEKLEKILKWMLNQIWHLELKCFDNKQNISPDTYEVMREKCKKLQEYYEDIERSFFGEEGREENERSNN